MPYPVCEIGQFDDYPPRTFTLKDSAGDAIDLTDATTVYLYAWRKDTGASIIEATEVTISDTPTDGQVTWDPSGDGGCTDVAVDLMARFTIKWTDKYQTTKLFIIRVYKTGRSENP